MFNLVEISILTEIANRFSYNYPKVGHYKEERDVIQLNEKIERSSQKYHLQKNTDAECFFCTEFRENQYQTLYVVFLGSNSQQDWAKNIKLTKRNWQYYLNSNDDDKDQQQFYVHQGIFEQFNSLIPTLNTQIQTFLQTCQRTDTEFDLVFSGHSLGGALAMLAGLYFQNKFFYKKKKVKIVTIGAPAVFSEDLALLYETQLKKTTFQIINHLDSIPNIPLYTRPDTFLLYFHGDKLKDAIVKRTWQDRVKSVLKGFDNHNIAVYIKNLKAFPFIKHLQF